MTSQFSPVDAPNADQERSSQSPSDDASNDGDPSQSLTSQTLNADGTPKRPMNAFMIFARRRRPQVSSENQSMRTGEISKILSKEWNSMPPSEKQFYLDRAKELKETFNSKYPDYVYRRRPNNSRRKRKDNNGVHSVDASGPSPPPHLPSPADPHHHPHHLHHDPGIPRQPYDDHMHLQHRPPPGPGGLPGYGPSDPYGRDSSSRQHPYLSSDRGGPPPPMNHNGPSSASLPSPRLPGPPSSTPALHSYLSQNMPPMQSSHSSWGGDNHHPRLDTKLDNGHGSHGRSSSSGSNGWGPPGGPERSASRGYPGQSGSPNGHHGPGDNGFSFPSLANNSPSSFFPTPSQMFNSSSSTTGSPTSSTAGPGGGPGGPGGGGPGGGGSLSASTSSSSASGGGPGSAGPGGGGSSAFGASSNQLPPPPGGLSLNGNTSNARGSYDIHQRTYAPSPPPFPQSASRHSLVSGGGGGGPGGGLHLPPVQSIPGYQSGLGPASAPVQAVGAGGGGEIGDLWSRG